MSDTAGARGCMPPHLGGLLTRRAPRRREDWARASACRACPERRTAQARRHADDDTALPRGRLPCLTAAAVELACRFCQFAEDATPISGL